ncbi:MAG: MFS transporter, partial [Burkholderiaceae bacterium]
YGPARVLAIGALLAGVGSLLFALSPTSALAAIGRALIGGSHAVAWVAMLQLVTHWFPLNRFGTMSGLSLTVGVIGAVLAGPPLRWMTDAFGWRLVIGAGGVLAIGIAITIRQRVRDDPSSFGYAPRVPARVRRDAGTHNWHGLIDIWKSRNTGLLFMINSGVCGSFLTFTGLWGVPYLTQIHALSVQQATLITSAMLVLFALGGPLIGTWSDRLQRRKVLFLAGAAMLAASFVTLAAAPAAPLPLLVPLLLAGAFGASAMALSFGYASASVPANLQGTVTGAVNMGVMMGPLVQMPLIGHILDSHWRGALIDGVRQYDAAAYQSSWLLLAGWSLLSVLLLLFTQEARANKKADALSPAA